MKVKINDVREWFKNLSFNEKCNLCIKYFGHRNFNIITDGKLKDCFTVETNQTTKKIEKI